MRRKSYYVIFNTTAGWVGILSSSKGIKHTTLPQPSREKAQIALSIDTEDTAVSQQHLQDLINRLKDYFAGRHVDFPDKLDLSETTAFRRRVWEATRCIPYGHTRSYAWVAKQIGKLKAVRAVGQALSRNPLPIIIPCHRVLKNDGSLGGFGGGLEMKKHLLSLENANT